jgi:hypothetical protein
VKQGEVEKVLREIAKGCSVRRAAQSQLVRLHVELLSIILDESNEQYVFFQPYMNIFMRTKRIISFSYA